MVLVSGVVGFLFTKYIVVHAFCNLSEAALLIEGKIVGISDSYDISQLLKRTTKLNKVMAKWLQNLHHWQLHINNIQ